MTPRPTPGSPSGWASSASQCCVTASATSASSSRTISASFRSSRHDPGSGRPRTLKILYAWLKEFVDTRLAPAGVQDALTMAGVEVSSCRFLGEGLDNVVTAKIRDQGPHPNADKLSV